MHLSSVITGATVLCALAVAAAAAVLDHRDDLNYNEKLKITSVTAWADDFSKPEKYERWPAGAGTSKKVFNKDAFSQFLPNLSFEEEQRAKVGNGIFKKIWVSSPSSTQASDGLGPLYNARACQRCHLKDGRGQPPGPGEAAVSMFLRLSVPPRNAAERAALAAAEIPLIPEPTYGTQLQNFAVPGHSAEGEMVIEYEEIPVTLNGGEVAFLRKPSYSIDRLAYGPLDPKTLLSPRIANQMIGLGLLEAIHEGDILALSDPEDRDGDGISGRPNWVRNEDTGKLAVGRFGWKAGNPSIRQQSAHAFTGDIGISTSLTRAHWGECTARQEDCRSAPDGVQLALGDVEAPDNVLDLVTFYARSLAVPARRDLDDGDVLTGKALFYGAGCATCHMPKFVTRRDAEPEAYAFQLIWPYSDLLLHDMGEGLSDNRPEWKANGREWRTAPLWGIGLTETVNGHTKFLHDGRARNLLEAVLWHGGEAEQARQMVVDMTPGEREALLAFVGSL
ncbi:di-heme oxidoredictase family protein [Pelagibius sp. Alg239-R121]|uniref:di-heme oxidoreductase family protein n=1 Tax=Pelagibius sp. Alg239-R121 TaxID=2993448 RepID=UPI0024A74A34|nr:di-heme oxidoredictase family protein [Pelagibius sp. Alg239-R121]